MGWKDSNGDGIIEDARGNPVTFSLKTNSSNTTRIAMMNFIKADLAKVGINVITAPVDFNTLITNLRSDFQYEAMLLGLQSGVPPDPDDDAERVALDGPDAFLVSDADQARHAAGSAHRPIDGRHSRARTNRGAPEGYNRSKRLRNEMAWMTWLPVRVQKIPVSNRFGNIQPSILRHRFCGIRTTST